MHPTVKSVRDRIEERSRDTRAAYMEKVASMRGRGRRDHLACGNLAHGFAGAQSREDQMALKAGVKNIGIITAYNDMLSAHAPYEDYPKILREAAREVRATAQVASGVPAMCDGVTQGQDGMELSLFSRDVIAMATAIGLSHDMFDAVLCLGICDKIVPGLTIGALSFGHLPTLMVPGGPMTSGLPNKEKARIRALYAEGKIGREELLQGEMDSYHSHGTCTFYGTANSNQMLMELMGLHLPGAAFVNPGTPLRNALTREAAKRVVKMGPELCMAEVCSAGAFVNAVAGLHATGGSTNHTLHLVAMARAAGWILTWDDIAELSSVVPLLARVYPNGPADVNHFHAAGGLAFVTRELLKSGLLCDDVVTAMGPGLSEYTKEPILKDGELVFREGTEHSLNTDIVRTVEKPFAAQGGLKLLEGNLGRSVIKTSAVAPEHRVVEAPAIVFHTQDEFLARFKAGELDRDFVAVLRFQGPAANGMPELHKLSPQLGVLQDRGRKVALVTDGRMSGASGKTPAAIHVTPEAIHGGPIARVRDGDVIRLDANAGTLEAKVGDLMDRAPEVYVANTHDGLGRELFGGLRSKVGPADEGACTLFA
ncbi:phosphogluconate dehydratase [Parvularcula dongshanensis]|uniref:Phosphogluconate dehydratase n=1 Tax=Parvularcula dongshanensis TaxID=1173995 RepID=A0A840I262_9PROT|nr:phosphogluconate dehydratase [Parvularcula dongshanensis]MBB4658425.1 phosphogluconate dehydratase [Parvularcula dongshanensis]